ncbi:MAG: alpha/beta hydrolase [Chitinophagaceae bacterium]|nr:MAG: alpha/beta hydrolase [Chitinophagaceae bacterium]
MIDRNTASGPNVHIIDTAFFMPQLGRYRRIWLYLPPEYAGSERRFPVLYMHDGQNLFEDWSAFGEEWQVDETIDAMDRKCIVVGIDNGGEHRLREYNVHDHAELGKGEGRRYLSFIVDTLKPYIDRTYRTRPERAHTSIAGSSMGGLISYYAAMLHPEVFGRAGIFSPSFWLQPSILEETRDFARRTRPVQDLYFYAGELEGAEMAARVRAVTSLLHRHPQFRIQEHYDPTGTHSEAEWRAHFPEFYQWLMGVRRKERSAR